VGFQYSTKPASVQVLKQSTNPTRKSWRKIGTRIENTTYVRLIHTSNAVSYSENTEDWPLSSRICTTGYFLILRG